MALIRCRLGGTAGTSLTCPLEVIKTRMQSSEGCDSRRSDGGQPSTSTTSNPSNSSRAVRRIVPHMATSCVKGRAPITSPPAAFGSVRTATVYVSTNSANLTNSSPSSVVFRRFLELPPLFAVQSRSNSSTGVFGLPRPKIYRYFV